MGLDQLIARLEHDVDAQVQAILAAAGADVGAITAAADQSVATHTAAMLAERRAERHAVFRRELGDLRLTLRARELAAAHAVLDRVFRRAHEILPEAARSAAWSRLWPVVLSEALAYAPERPCRIRCAPEAMAACRERVAGRTAVLEDPGFGPGLIVETLDGSLTVDCSLASLLDQQRPLLSIGVLEEVTRHA